MSIKIHNFMGRFGWEMQKHFPMLSSTLYLKLQRATREKSQKKYIEYVLKNPNEAPMPLVVNLETINRCNSDCAFCTANKYAEKRPFKRMEDELFYHIIDELADWGFKGHLTLYGNNEPWLDTRIVEFHKYCREKLPNSFIFMSTNGLLLDIDKVKSIVPYVDQLIINNYCEDMKLHENVKEIYSYVKANPEEFKDVDVTALNKRISDLESEKANIQKDYDAKIADRDFDDLVKESIAAVKGKNVKAITALLDVDALKASKNQKEDIASALKDLTEAEDSKMLFGDPEPNPAGTGNLIGQVQKTPGQSTDTLKDALKERYK